MSTQSPLPQNDPLLIEFQKLKKTQGYKNAVNWTIKAENESQADGELWFGFAAGWSAHAVESVLQCVVCGERSFVISPINDSDGFCFAEQKIYSITWPTLADPDGNIAEAGCDYCEHCHEMNQTCGKCGREWSGDIQRKEYP